MIESWSIEVFFTLIFLSHNAELLQALLMIMWENEKFYIMEKLNNNEKSQHTNQPSDWLEEKRVSPTLSFTE